MKSESAKPFRNIKIAITEDKSVTCAWTILISKQKKDKNPFSNNVWENMDLVIFKASCS